MRDYQRGRLYKAERRAFEIYPKEALARELDWCEEFAQKIINTEHWKKHEGWRCVKLHSGAGHRSAKYYKARKGKQRTVVLPKWARSQIVMIHEFAHALTDRTHKSATGHGTYFCGHYIALVQELLGGDMGEYLAGHFDDHKVRYINL